MTPLALIRHGTTDWGEAGLIQGRADRPLSAAGRAQVAAWRVPAELAGFEWLASPLRRARESAELLLGRAVQADPAFTEMAWGAWEGQALSALRRTLGAALNENEARGLDFRPPGGESPREVQTRLIPRLDAIARADRPTAAITHKGVIRAVLGLATGWDFHGKPPARLDWPCAHLFALDGGGRPRIERLNIALVER